MSYKIVVDSCCELLEEYKRDERFQIISLGLEVGDYSIMDDEKFNQAQFLRKVAECPACPKSSCPSPESYMNAYRTEAENIYVVTLSSKLSGSFNSAVLGKNLYHETYGKKNIHVVDSHSASVGETQLALKAMELEEAGLSFEVIVKELEEFKTAMNTYFVLENLDTLRKNGRLSGVKSIVASTLNIKPVMGATEGSIVQLGQGIGIKKALQKMVDRVADEVKNPEKKILMISHCNCPERAENVKQMLEKMKTFQKCIILETAGISSMYANDGGVIIAV